GGGPSAAGTAGGLDGVGGRFLAYAAAVGFEGPPAGFGDLLLLDGSPAPELGEDQALLNEWAARRLDARVGDVLEISYFRVGEGERLVSEEHRLELAGVVRMSGLGADPSLTPDYPGISDSDDISDWDPPFPVDLDLVTPDDEAYWDDLRGAPKLFVGAATASRLWSSRYGDVTALRIAPAAGADLDGLRRAVETDLPHAIDPSAFGLDLEPVRHQALAAAVGATDFAQLFVAFSWFLILAAALLVGLLFGLGVEQRAAEVGLLRAVGFREATVRRRFLVEGFVVGALGCGVGVVLAVGYAALLMRGLRTWWLPAVGSRELTLHLSVVSLAVGFASSLAVVVLAIFVVLRRLRRVSAPVLLAGSVDPEDRRRRGRLARGAVALGALLVVGLAAVALAAGGGGAAVFFGLGAGVLLLGLGLFSLWCRSRGGTSVHSAVLTSGRLGLWRLAVRNSARNPGRSILSVTLVACACFVLVAAAANRRDLTAVDHGRESGTGGYALVARSDVPLFDDLNEPDGRYELGLPDDEALWQDVRVYSLRRLPGDDASCLNLYRPESPQVLGVSRAFRDRGGFHFHATASPTDDPWSLLDEDLDTDEITGAPLVPAVADFESATWILKLGLGDDVVLSGSDGQPLHLRLVGLLDASLFQSEILISEEQMLRHFPTVEGYSDFLIDAPAAKASEVATMLEAGLGGFGFDATGAAEKLASFKAVQNTYLSTFQTLGGLGLLLGTLGLAVVLTRNVYERRDELAALRAFGFRRSLLRTLILEESVVLLLLGMLLGTGAALIGVAPYLSAAGAAVPWRSLLLTLAAVFLAGLAACGLAASRALRGELLPQLRGE
ncbi:MAG: ABC transporter permease, partial [Acidobacteria bacterium]|nr:ABC transporter permease [Acidobacteriota bacterium]